MQHCAADAHTLLQSCSLHLHCRSHCHTITSDSSTPTRWQWNSIPVSVPLFMNNAKQSVLRANGYVCHQSLVLPHTLIWSAQIMPGCARSEALGCLHTLLSSYCLHNSLFLFSMLNTLPPRGKSSVLSQSHGEASLSNIR